MQNLMDHVCVECAGVQGKGSHGTIKTRIMTNCHSPERRSSAKLYMGSQNR